MWARAIDSDHSEQAHPLRPQCFPKVSPAGAYKVIMFPRNLGVCLLQTVLLFLTEQSKLLMTLKKDVF